MGFIRQTEYMRDNGDEMRVRLYEHYGDKKFAELFIWDNYESRGSTITLRKEQLNKLIEMLNDVSSEVSD